MTAESTQTNQGVFADARWPVSTRTVRVEADDDVAATGRSPFVQYGGR